MPTFSTGMTVRARGERFQIISAEALPHSTGEPKWRLLLRGLEGDLRSQYLSLIFPVDTIEVEGVQELNLDQLGRLSRFRLLHQAFSFEMAPAENILISAMRTRINFEPYQYVPALRALSLPRPRLLLADDVGLGKTIEAGIILRELTARRRANRVLIVCPAGIQQQWRDELANRFGFDFKIFNFFGAQQVASGWRKNNQTLDEVGTIPATMGDAADSQHFALREHGTP